MCLGGPDTHDPRAQPTPLDLDRTFKSSDLDGQEPTGEDPSEGELTPTRIGRFTVLDRLGRGGMGMVFMGFDVELDRKVAIKLLLPEHGGPEARIRLMREAQAMAKLSHPNVVQIYEVGTHALGTGEAKVFIAMEFVRGDTLGDWLEPERSLEEILQIFTQAGRGLSAAHHAGLVHRDFKPDNVMVGDDGRVRVLDFGLAAERDHGRPPRQRPAVEDQVHRRAREHSGRAGDDSLTRTGAIMGTPAYMSPEQHLGLEAGPGSDQFSFCVALYTAVYRQAPFAGRKLLALMRSVTSGELRDPPKSHEAPAKLLRVLTRGLSVEPSERFVSMDELLAELERLPPPGARRLGLTALAVAVIGGAVMLRAAIQREPDPEPCAQVGDALSEVWSMEREQAIAASFDASALPYAAETWIRIQPRLDAYALAWVDARRDTCEATHLRHEQSGALLDRRMRCLDGRRTELDAALELLEQADSDVVRHAASMVPSPAELERCAPANLSAQDDARANMDPELAEAAGELELLLARASARYDAGKYDDGLALAEQVEARAGTLGLPSIEAQAGLQAGLLHERNGDYRRATQTLTEGYFTALSVDDDDTAIACAAQLTFVVGAREAHFDRGLAWGRHGESLLARAQARAKDRDTRRLQATLDNNIGVVLKAQGDIEGAHQRYTSALALRLGLSGESELRIASLHNNLALVSRSRGDHSQAIAEIDQAIEIWERLYGPIHPELVLAYNNAGLTANSAGQLERARAHYLRAIEIGEASLGPDHPTLGHPYNNLGALDLDADDLDAAGPNFERALAIWTAAHGPDHIMVSVVVFNLAEIAQRSGDHALAIERYEQTLRIDAETLGADDPSLASADFAIAVSAEALGDFERARSEYERVVELNAGLEEREIDAELLAQSQFNLAKLVLVLDRAPRSAERLAQAAYVHADVEQRADIEAWLAELELELPLE